MTSMACRTGARYRDEAGPVASQERQHLRPRSFCGQTQKAFYPATMVVVML